MMLKRIDQTLKDFYPLHGTRIKQYVVDTHREYAWERETAPRFTVDPHEDNCGSSCRNVGNVPWTYLDHDSCGTCNDLHALAEKEPAVIAWLAEKAKRPPIESDEAKLSDEIAEDVALRPGPWAAMVRR